MSIYRVKTVESFQDPKQIEHNQLSLLFMPNIVVKKWLWAIFHLNSNNSEEEANCWIQVTSIVEETRNNVWFYSKIRSNTKIYKSLQMAHSNQILVNHFWCAIKIQHYINYIKSQFILNELSIAYQKLIWLSFLGLSIFFHYGKRNCLTWNRVSYNYKSYCLKNVQTHLVWI